MHYNGMIDGLTDHAGHLLQNIGLQYGSYLLDAGFRMDIHERHLLN